MLARLTQADCLAAIASGEFPESIRSSAPKVAIVLTQGWCHQWGWMESYLGEISSRPGVDIYWVAYDEEPFFDEFRSFKERVFGNDQVPYVRYYSHGSLKRISNYIDKSGFLRLLGA